MQLRESFPSEVTGKLQCYVNRLIDPRNGKTLKCGQGQRESRVCTSLGGTRSGGLRLDNKVRRIREIRLAGFEVVPCSTGMASMKPRRSKWKLP
jgi:hypothetical protein